MKSHSIKKIIFGLISTLMIGVVLFKIESTKIEDNETSAASSTVIIKELYGGGGQTGSTYNRDYIELYNVGTSTVSINYWSLRYTEATSNIWTMIELSGSIAPSSFFLVSLGPDGDGSTFDADMSVSQYDGPGLDVTAGKLALCNNRNNWIDGIVQDPTGFSAVIDFVGYGATANAYEGSGPAPSMSITTSIQRQQVPLIDNDDNAYDFTTASPSPNRSNVNGLTEAISFSSYFINSISYQEGMLCSGNGSFIWSDAKYEYNSRITTQAGRSEFAINENSTVTSARNSYKYLVNYNHSLEDFAGLRGS